jgi:hypothetical protein
MRSVSVQRSPDVPAGTGIERALLHAPMGLLAVGVMLFAAVAALAVVLLRAH